MEERFEIFTLLISKCSRAIRKIKTEEMSEFKLKDIRKDKHLSRRELAEQSGVNEQTIRFLEEEINDPTNAKLSTLVKLARALKCRVKDFYPCEKVI